MSPHKKINRLTSVFSLAILGVLVFLGFIPLASYIISRYEGEWFPVIKNVNVDYVGNADNGIYVDVSFDKARACEFIGISWYDSFGDRLPILFKDKNEEILTTRPTGDNQRAKPWKIIGIDRLDGSTAIISHRCHKLWITYTQLYP